jgi:ketosteroid isomerase-like protein
MRVSKVRTELFVWMLVLAGPVSAHEPTTVAAKQSTMPAIARGAAATVDTFHAALHRGDTAAAAALLTQDALIFESGGVERSKAEYVAHHLPADAAFSRQVLSTVTSRSGNAFGNLAWIASEGETSGAYKGKELNLVTTETMVLRRVGRGWKITHIHWSSAAK